MKGRRLRFQAYFRGSIAVSEFLNLELPRGLHACALLASSPRVHDVEKPSALSFSLTLILCLTLALSHGELSRAPSFFFFSVPPPSPPAAATISASSPPPHARSAVSQGCRCSRQRCHQQGRRGRHWRTWPGGYGPLLAGPRPDASEARRRQAPARVPRCSIATPPPPTSSLRPKSRAPRRPPCFDSRQGPRLKIREKGRF